MTFQDTKFKFIGVFSLLSETFQGFLHAPLWIMRTFLFETFGLSVDPQSKNSIFRWKGRRKPLITEKSMGASKNVARGL